MDNTNYLIDHPSSKKLISYYTRNEMKFVDLACDILLDGISFNRSPDGVIDIEHLGHKIVIFKDSSYEIDHVPVDGSFIELLDLIRLGLDKEFLSFVDLNIHKDIDEDAKCIIYSAEPLISNPDPVSRRRIVTFNN